MKINSVSLLLGAVLLLTTSCVPNRKYVYFQMDDVKTQPEEVDTVTRLYNIDKNEYRIQPNDALYVSFESLTAEKFDFLKRQGGIQAGSTIIFNSELVDPAGEISLPVINNVKVSGMTVFEVQDTLQHLANLYLESPTAKVRIANFRFTVLGEVKVEGTVSTFNSRVTVPEALGLAGGLDELADKAKIKLIRQTNDSVKVVYLNLLEEEFINSPYYYVHQHDVLIVPPLRQRSYRKYFGQNLSLVLSSVSIVLLVLNLTR